MTVEQYRQALQLCDELRNLDKAGENINNALYHFDKSKSDTQNLLLMPDDTCDIIGFRIPTQIFKEVLIRTKLEIKDQIKVISLQLTELRSQIDKEDEEKDR